VLGYVGVMMKLDRKTLDDAIGAGVLPAAQAEALWRFLGERHEHTPSFKPAHILYYLGGLIAVGALTLFMTLGWERFGGPGLLAISLAYGIAATAITESLLRRRLRLPAGLTGVLAIATVPLAVYALQHVLGFWPAAGAPQSYRDYHELVDWRWIFMEVATLMAASLALWRYRLPFLVLPVAVTLWYMSMDLTPFLFGGDAASFFSDRAKIVSIVFGLAVTGLAVVVDVRSRNGGDFAFWLYVFGVLTFWGGLSAMNSNSELGKFVYCLINLAMIAIGAALSRRVFAVLGGLGVAGYLAHLSHSVFKDSMLFPIALTAIGLGIVACGVLWQRHERELGRWLRRWLPAPVSQLVEARA
jgi:hypothetical protein